MKKILIICPSFWLLINIYGQDVKTGTGQSSILLETTNIGFDIGEPSLSFTTNNFPQSKLKSKGPIWGFLVKGKNDNDLATIFTSSSIVPSSELNAIYGYSFSNMEQISASYKNRIKIKADSIYLLSDTLNKKLDILISTQANKISNIKAKEYIQNVINTIFKNELLKYERLEKELKKISENNFLDTAISKSSAELYASMKRNKLWNDYKRLTKEISGRIDSISTENYWKFSIYGHLGLNSTKFNLYNGWDSMNIDNSFSKQTFNGSKGGFGLNLNIKSKWLFGFRYTYEETNNLSLLTPNDYKVTKTFKSGSTTGSSEVSMNAYPKTYKRAYLNNFDFDIISFLPLAKSNILLADIYFRFKESTNHSVLVSQKDVGISCSFFKEQGKFIGGIYLELPDIEQSVEKIKPVNEQKLTSWYQRLSFGVYAKFSFSSIVNQF